MIQDDRETLITDLKRKLKVRTDIELMNELNELRLVADEAVTIQDVADCDLVRAWNRKQDDRAYSALMNGETHL